MKRKIQFQYLPFPSQPITILKSLKMFKLQNGGLHYSMCPGQTTLAVALLDTSPLIYGKLFSDNTVEILILTF